MQVTIPCAARRLGPLLLVLLLAGCAGQKGAVPGALAQPGRVQEATAAVQAFVRICADLTRDSVVRQAATYGFTPVNVVTLPPAMARMLERDDGIALVRPQLANPPVVMWSERQGSCTLTTSDLDPAEAEAAFGRMLQALANRPELQVDRIPPSQLAALDGQGHMRVRVAAVAIPRALVPGGARGFLLMHGTNPNGLVQVSMAAARATHTAPGAPARGAAMPQGERKD